jgi:hypothetical protein
MVGTSGMVADVYNDPLDTSDPNSVHHFRDIGIDSHISTCSIRTP